MGKRFGGRQKGTPNKKTKELNSIAERLDVDPFEILLLFAKGDWKALGYSKEFELTGFGRKYTLEPSVRAKCAAEACNYLFPKRKAIEHSLDEDLSNTIKSLTGDQLDARIKELSKSLKGK